MSLKDDLYNDIDVIFLDFDEFAQMHNIDGQNILVVVDNDKLAQRGDYSGLTLGQIMYFAKVNDLKNKPKIQMKQVFDSRSMYIAECIENFGMYQITLSQTLGGD